MNEQSKTPSIAELCAPISATVIPESQRYGPGGRKLTEAEARMKQRTDGAKVEKRKKRKEA